MYAYLFSSGSQSKPTRIPSTVTQAHNSKQRPIELDPEYQHIWLKSPILKATKTPQGSISPAIWSGYWRL